MIYWVYFGQGEDLKLTTELSEKVQYSHHQTIKDGLNEAILHMWIKRALTFAMKLCVFQVTKTSFCMKVIRIFNAQLEKYPL